MGRAADEGEQRTMASECLTHDDGEVKRNGMQQNANEEVKKMLCIQGKYANVGTSNLT